ncbi:P-loop containing nucleoside triphosphate hydrolase protein [Thelonectria olida]|uniref:P-loop containing nucleoside triphosphate hydrolase protein n=1 Tax=Thelonectria olida TaxID=1576542 RepID=A0A9P9AKR4_9HYPO|nr:P-loop containing nucleoside triphosphate hydrolase protein [Thelonectria olida]
MHPNNGDNSPAGGGTNANWSLINATNGSVNETTEPSRLSEFSTSSLALIPERVSILDAGTDESTMLDLITELQQLGIEDHYDMPQIIVCGSQSAGKSSVLEAITGIPFPKARETCTKFVTQVTIRNSDDSIETVEVKINPADKSDKSRTTRLSGFYRQTQGTDCLTQLSSILQDAKNVIFKDVENNRLVTKDIVQVTITGPNKQPLQLFDLPGLMGTDTGAGEQEDVERIVKQYMAMPQSIILAVVKASGDINGFESTVLGWCKKEFDPEGTRTIGVVTHPDQSGSREHRWIRLLQGDATEFHLKNQWHVLRNPSTESTEEGTRPEDRGQWERDWFQRSSWSEVSEERRGANALRDRLGKLLFSRLRQRLPGLRRHLCRLLAEFESKLDKLGDTSATERVRVFRQRMEGLRKAANDHARGIYESDIAGDFPPETEAYLRSRVVEKGEQLRDNIIYHGHAWNSHISPTAPGPDTDLKSLGSPKEVPQEWSTRQFSYENGDEEIKKIAKELEQLRGQELAGHTDPARIKHLFWRMSKPWPKIAKQRVEEILYCCEQYIRMMALNHFELRHQVQGSTGFPNAEAIARRYVDKYVLPRLGERRLNALEELQELDKDRKGTLINYDFAFLEEQRNYVSQQHFQSTIKASHVLEGQQKTQNGSPEPLECRKFAQAAGRFSQEEQINNTAGNFLHDTRKHYDIVRGQFIANVMTQVVERHILRKFDDVFPKDFTDEQIERLTVEDPESERKRGEILGQKKQVGDLLNALEHRMG